MQKIHQVNKEEILTKLREVLDPELNYNIVDLGLVYEIKVQKNKVKVIMTLTYPGCPLGGLVKKLVEDKLKELPGISEVDSQFTFTPPWDPSRMSEEARLEVNLPLSIN